MFVTIETLTRPSLDVKFPTVHLEGDLGVALTEQANARKTSAAWVGASFEKSADGLTAVITNIWTDKAGKAEFVRNHAEAVKRAADLRDEYLKANGITSTVTAQVENLTLANAKARLINARARSKKVTAARLARAAKAAAAKAAA
jgi:hypothetical protein